MIADDQMTPDFSVALIIIIHHLDINFCRINIMGMERKFFKIFF